MTKHQAICHFGSQAALARALGIGRASVHAWTDQIPLDRQCQIEIITQGALTADRHLLFPVEMVAKDALDALDGRGKHAEARAA